MEANVPSHTLQYRNRRGHFYWSYPLTGPLKAIALNGLHQTQSPNPDLVAIAQDEPTTGLWINLRPFTVKRRPLGIAADWISSTPWGYILVNTIGQILCLNRRGRSMAQGTLPIANGTTVRAIAWSGAATLWIALQYESQTCLYTLDLTNQLPRSLLRL